MKIAQIGDIHISDTRLEEFAVMLPDLADAIRAENPDLVVFTGDLFIHRDRLTPTQVELARKFFKEDLKGLDYIITVGNHDISMSATKADSISAIFANDLNIFNKVGDIVEKDDYVFHMFPYPSKKEMERLDIKDIGEVYYRQDIFDTFNIVPGKKNVLVYHGTLEGFNVSDDYVASEEAINVGKDCVLPKTFWQKFDATMAGHLHRYQLIENASYSGAPFPLTFKDSFATGFVMWNNLKPMFKDLKQKFPYITVEIGNLTGFVTGLTEEAERRIENDYSYEGARVRIKYTVNSSQSGNVDHSVLSKYFRDAREVKIVPDYVNIQDTTKHPVSFEDFQHHTIQDVIESYIDTRKYNPEVKNIAKKIEKKMKEEFSEEDGQGIHFKVLELSLNNFKCFGEENPTIYFEELNPLTGIFGENRSGKSSLLEAIGWGLFGQTLRNKDVKSVVRNGQDTTVIDISFNSYKTKYKIRRERGKKSSLSLFTWSDNLEDWVDISGATATVTQKNIEKIIGTFDMFISTSYAPQGNIDLLIQKKPSERKQIILDCLQIDVLEHRQTLIGNLKKQVRDELNQEKGRINAYSDQISSIMAAHPTEVINEYEGLIKSAEVEKARIQVHLNGLNKKVYEYESLEDDYKRVEEQLTELRKRIKDYEYKILTKNSEREKFLYILENKHKIEEGLRVSKEAQEQVDRYSAERTVNSERTSKMNDIKSEISKLSSSNRDKVNLIQQQIDSIDNRVKNITLLDCSKPDCPLNAKVQNQKLDLEEEKNKLLLDIESEKAAYAVEYKKLEGRVEDIQSEIDKSFYNKSDHMTWYNALENEKKKKWEELQYKIASGDEILSSLDELIASYNVQQDELRTSRDEFVKRRTDIATKMETIQKYNKEVDKTKVELDAVKTRIDNYTKQIYKAKHDMEEMNTLQKQLNNSQEEVKYKEEYFNHCNKYSEIVSKHGVIFSIVDKALPIIETFAQELLSEATNGLVSLSIDSFKTLSTGKQADDVMIYLIDSKGKRDVSEASGAELVLISLALRAAMSHLLSLRMGSKVELFIIDEGFGAFDGSNLLSVKDMMKKLSQRFNKVLFITHVEELKDIAQSTINVTSNDLVSKFNIKETKNVAN